MSSSVSSINYFLFNDQRHEFFKVNDLLVRVVATDKNICYIYFDKKFVCSDISHIALLDEIHIQPIRSQNKLSWPIREWTDVLWVIHNWNSISCHSL